MYGNNLEIISTDVFPVQNAVSYNFHGYTIMITDKNGLTIYAFHKFKHYKFTVQKTRGKANTIIMLKHNTIIIWLHYKITTLCNS